MIHQDVSQWPLVIAVFQGPQTPQEIEAFTSCWKGWLSWNEPFAMLRIFRRPAPLLQFESSEQLLHEWMKQHSAAIRRNVIGMASVLPAARYEATPAMNTALLPGMPAATFGYLNTALHWLEARVFQPHELSFNRTAVQVALASAA